MNHYNQSVIYERSNIIPIPQISPTNKTQENEYSLKQHFFDPSKSSPPNDFMLKLHLRMSLYNSFNKEDNLMNE
jgi:hypothetical protein